MNTTRSEKDLITMRFRTTKQDGVLLYADGNQGDFMSLELRRGYVFFRIDLGKGNFRTLLQCGHLFVIFFFLHKYIQVVSSSGLNT